MAISIVCALIVVVAMGLWFSTTRAIAIIALAALAFIAPWLAVVILIGSAAAFYLFRIRKP